MYYNAYQEASVLWIITQEDYHSSARHMGASAGEEDKTLDT